MERFAGCVVSITSPDDEDDEAFRVALMIAALPDGPAHLYTLLLNPAYRSMLPEGALGVCFETYSQVRA